MRRLARAGAALAWALASSGCVVGPHYSPPPPPRGTTAPLVSVDPAIESVAAPPDAWWRLYQDPELDRLIQEAFAANHDLKAAEANLTAARAVLAGARAELFPGTQLLFQAQRGRDAVTNEILELTGREPFTLWLDEALINISWELDLFGRVRSSVAAARADAQASQAALDQAKVVIAGETARAYASICALGAQVVVSRESVATVAGQARIVANRLEAGGGSQLDLARSLALVGQTQSGTPPLEGQRRAAVLELAALLGRAPVDAPHEVEACATPPKLTAPLPVGDAVALLKRRPDIREAERRLAGSAARVGVATADLYPRVSFTGHYGGAAPSIPDLFTNIGLTWGVGPTVTWSFPNQIAARARLRQAKAVHEAELEAFDSTVLKALSGVERAIVSYNVELERRKALGVTQAHARQAFDIAREAYLAGAFSNLDVLTAEQTLINADAAVAASDAAIVQYQVAIFRELGGGWGGP